MSENNRDQRKKLKRRKKLNTLSSKENCTSAECVESIGMTHQHEATCSLKRKPTFSLHHIPGKCEFHKERWSWSNLFNFLWLTFKFIRFLPSDCWFHSGMQVPEGRRLKCMHDVAVTSKRWDDVINDIRAVSSVTVCVPMSFLLLRISCLRTQERNCVLVFLYRPCVCDVIFTLLLGILWIFYKYAVWHTYCITTNDWFCLEMYLSCWARVCLFVISQQQCRWTGIVPDQRNCQWYCILSFWLCVKKFKKMTSSPEEGSSFRAETSGAIKRLQEEELCYWM